jgi:integrase
VSRKDYGSGSVYQAHRADCPKAGKCSCPWRGATQAGFTRTGARRRVTVSGRTEAEAKRKLRDKVADIKAGNVSMSPTTTVKAWADTWLPIKRDELSPNGYNALASPVRRWVIPTIGHRRLASLTPADVRAVEQAQRDAGRKGTTCAATQRALFNMLRAALAEGHAVPQRVLLTPTPKTKTSDRQPLTIPESLAVLAQAADLPHGTRWAIALLNGLRQGECLGMTWDQVDLERLELTVEWQLQRLVYLDRKNPGRGFRVPHEHESRHLYKSWHLVKPKSKAGARVHPILPPIAEALARWREVVPDNPYDLVWPAADGKPRASDDDRDEWQALQKAAGVAHPSGRPYHVHECRNVTATELRSTGADDLTITSLLGHTSIGTSQGYMRVSADAKREALARVARLLELG